MIPLNLLVPLIAGLLAALIFLAVRHTMAQRNSVAHGTVIYSDADGKGRTLSSPRRPLAGKPDYVVRTRRGDHVPIEYKSYRYGTQAPHVDLIQLGAYLLLLEDLHGTPPPYGLLRYRDRTLRVPFKPALRREVLRVLSALEKEDGSQSDPTPQPDLCRSCPFAPVCDAARR